MNLQSELRNWWSSIQLRRNAAPFRVECDQGGFAQISEGAGEGHRVRLEWGQITEVFAFKRDCLLTDQIRIIVGNPDFKEWIEVPEDEDGYGELIQQLPTHLPGFPQPDAWWQSVALPPL
jgi:hypothetical protein